MLMAAQARAATRCENALPTRRMFLMAVTSCGEVESNWV